MYGSFLYHSKQLGRLALLGAIITLNACGGGEGASTTSATTNPTAVLGANEVAPVSGQTGGAVSVSQTSDGVSVSQTIGKNGGTLRMEGIELQIPPGALLTDKVITITSLKSVPASQSHWLLPGTKFYEFSPSGTVFLSNVQIKLYAPLGADPNESKAIAWTRNGTLEFVPYYRSGDFVFAQSNHFSLASIIGAENISNTVVNILNIPLTGLRYSIKALEVVGSIEYSLFCKFIGKGDEGQLPCNGPYGSNKPLCLAPVYNSRIIPLIINPRTGLCWEAVLPEATPKDLGSILNTETLESGLMSGRVEDYNISGYEIRRNPTNGRLIKFNRNGIFTYAPNDGYVGIDTFSFVAVNELGESETAEVSVKVLAKERIERLKLVVPNTMPRGSEFNALVEAIDQYGAPIAIPDNMVFTWTATSPGAVSVSAWKDTRAATIRAVGNGSGGVCVADSLTRSTACSSVCVPNPLGC